jgi:hypothetical protein
MTTLQTRTCFSPSRNPLQSFPSSDICTDGSLVVVWAATNATPALNRWCWVGRSTASLFKIYLVPI